MSTTKKVEYEGKLYKISFTSYGYSDSRLCVEGEATAEYMNNGSLQNVEVFKKYAKRAIQQYIEKKTAERAFEEWDGKL